jgi:hypothetical protein
MTTLWGSKKQDEQVDQEGEESNMSRRSEEHGREATERDRLLPDNQQRRSNRSDGYLDPDDPAVSIQSSHRALAIND